VPRQDAQGRWISDDGLTFWDGTAWRPIGAAAPPAMAQGFPPQAAAAKSPWPAILIGCGIALLVVIVLGIVGVFALVSSPNFQHSFCNSWADSNPNQTCPFTTNSQ
jgi:hypothetical protein